MDNKKLEEEKNKKLLFAMYAMMGVSLAFYFLTLLITGFFVPEGIVQLGIILASTIIFLIAILFAIKLETEAGYYECKKCGHRFVATYKDVVWAMHMGTTRHLKCPECNKKSWSKKVMTKE